MASGFAADDGSGGNSSGGSAGDVEDEYVGEKSGRDIALRRALMLRWRGDGVEGELERTFAEVRMVVKSVSSRAQGGLILTPSRSINIWNWR